MAITNELIQVHSAAKDFLKPEHLLSILEESNDMIYILDLNGRFVWINKATQVFLKKASGEILGKTIFDIYPEEKAQKFAEDNQKVLASGEKYFSEVTLDLSGTSRSFLSIRSPIRDDAGMIIAIAIILREITERKKIDQMKSDLVSFASHQLRTPLAEINGFMEVVLEGLTGELNDKQRHYLNLVKNIARNGLRLVSDLLNVSRIERGMVLTELAKTNLTEIVRTLVNNYRDVAHAKNLSLEFINPKEEIYVMAEPTKLIEAIRNVLENAIKFSDKEDVKIKITKNKTGTSIEISDSGTGIPDQILRNLFSRETVLKQNKNPRSGAGLGLFIAKNFMVVQGGDILVETKPEVGSKFTLTLKNAF